MSEATTYPAVFNLTPIIPFLPLAAFVLIVLWANRSKKLSAALAIAGIALSWVISWAVAFTTFGMERFGENPVTFVAQLAAHGLDLAGVRLPGRSAFCRHALHGSVRLLPYFCVRSRLHGCGQRGERN